MSKKNKYYMRGIGVGIMVCALILIISRINTKAEISDEEIISRARALGMVESGDQSLTEATGVAGADTDTEPSEEAYVSPVVIDDTEPTKTPQVTDPVVTEEPDNDHDTEPVTEPSESPEPSPEPEPEPEPEITPDPQPSEEDPALTDLVYVTLTIYSGNSSDTVARRAEELGLVTNYKEFDSYLVSNGYANRIRVGSFEIPLGASYEYIAKAIT